MAPAAATIGASGRAAPGLDHTPRPVGQRHRAQPRAGLGVGAALPEPVGAVAVDLGEVGQASPRCRPASGGPRRPARGSGQPPGGQRVAPVEPVHQGALLARHEVVRRGQDLHVGQGLDASALARAPLRGHQLPLGATLHAHPHLGGADGPAPRAAPRRAPGAAPASAGTRSLALAGSPSVPLDHHDGVAGRVERGTAACAPWGSPRRRARAGRPRRPRRRASGPVRRRRAAAGTSTGAPRATAVRPWGRAPRAGGPSPRGRVGLVDLGTVGCGRAHDRLRGQPPRARSGRRAPRRRTCAGSRGRAALHAPGDRDADEHQAGGVERQHPGLTSVGADEEAVHHGDRPAHVGQPVHQPPRRERQAGPQRGW